VTNYALELTAGELARYRMMAEQARTGEAATWEAAGIVPGARVADVGCGPGAVLLAVADVVGAAGSVIGVDADPVAVATASELIKQAGLSNASAQIGKATDTGLEPGSFDVVLMRHVLAHNGPDEARIVQHLATLVRPGGCVFLVDVDAPAGRVLGADSDAMDLAERYIEFHRARGNDLQVGLRLGQLLQSAGLEVLSHQGVYSILSAPPGMRPPAWAARDAMVAEGHATAADLARWEAALLRTDAAADRPTLFFPLFSAIGRRR